MEQSLPEHDCKNFVRKVFLVLDGELNSDEQQNFIMDIERCQACLQHYHIEKEFKAFVSKGVLRKCCSETLRLSIISQIKNIEQAE
ncbi:MAG: hypothetical protein IPG60_00520 [Bacteroidetes bacterium]|nr:hypothetical protein [Bacteroidota bacterium]MBP7398502.1 hypothetical protein [Chitinophagales bacterium]MBK7107980.1 hypothetical protein [Bacteroidota bacterium]MBK8486587.1 hypothetical protein [Bacteroidota bacterium]MBK8683368.1 hypothetical protein [Bacteroidota bacterium]